MLSRRSFLLALTTASTCLALPAIAYAQALPTTVVPVPYTPQTRLVSFPTAANDNLSTNQRTFVNQQMTKTSIGIKSRGLGRPVLNKALRAIGTIARVARVGGPWGLLASIAIGAGLAIVLGDGNSFTFGTPESPNQTLTINPATPTQSFYFGYPHYPLTNDLPVGVTIARNSANNPTALVTYYRVDYPSNVSAPSSLADGWGRTAIQNGVSVGVNRATYSRPITATQIQNGIVITAPNAPGSIQPGIASTLTVPNSEADKVHQFMVKHALATDAASNGANAAFPGYTLGQPLPFAWPVEVPSTAPQTVGDLRADFPAIPSSVDPASNLWEISPTDFDLLPVINPASGASENPNPGTTTDGTGNPLTIPTGGEVTPDSGGPLPAFMDFVNPFNNLFDPFKAAFTGIDGACPTLTVPSINTSAWLGGSATTPFPITAHCLTIEPLRPAIIAAGTVIGALNAVDHILES